MATDLELLKFNLQETNYPYFNDSDLQLLLDQYTTVNKASYHGCMIKAQDDSVKLGPINTVSNEKYWLRRAKMFRTNATGTMKRADGT
jgi:hypothetical protein